LYVAYNNSRRRRFVVVREWK